jgi:hypothetical protein
LRVQNSTYTNKICMLCARRFFWHQIKWEQAHFFYHAGATRAVVPGWTSVVNSRNNLQSNHQQQIKTTKKGAAKRKSKNKKATPCAIRPSPSWSWRITASQRSQSQGITVRTISSYCGSIITVQCTRGFTSIDSVLASGISERKKKVEICKLIIGWLERMTRGDAEQSPLDMNKINYKVVALYMAQKTKGVGLRWKVGKTWWVKGVTVVFNQEWSFYLQCVKSHPLLLFVNE